LSLEEYHEKRDFSLTSEPHGGERPAGDGRSFCVQKHDASRLHYDFRLELDGVLLSWAVPKGPSLDPKERRLAMHVEDHPLEYGSFEGVIPKGEYGGGTVMLWDQGTWEPVKGDPRQDYRKGRLKFRLHGQRLQGIWNLVRLDGDDDKAWLLIKSRDEDASDTREVLEEATSVKTRRTMDEIAGERDAVWHSEDFDPSSVAGSRKAAFPAGLKPQLPQLAKEAPKGDKWLHELKYDGYRMLAFIHEGQPRLLTRTHQDWTHRYPAVVKALTSLPVNNCVLDGEIVVLDERGHSNFQALQRGGEPLYYVFDMPWCQGYDLTGVGLLERKGLLEEVLRGSPDAIRYSDHVLGQGPEFFEQASKLGVEGIISKRRDAIYEQKRSGAWVKVKCHGSQEFVVGGFTDPSGGRQGFGALLLGQYQDGELRFVGKVGTGFDGRTLQALTPRLEALERKTPPFANPPTGAEARGVHWVTPKLVAQVEYTEMTSEGILRHPSFKGLREDKPATDVVPEVVQAPRKKGLELSGVVITNPDRVVYPEIGLTKGEVAEYYQAALPRILPHLVNRPLALVRCPQGFGKACFYHKHRNDTFPKAVRGVPVEESDGPTLHLCIDDAPGLLTLIQFGGLEIHPWGCQADRMDRPDRLVMDLDPAPDVPWEQVIEATLEVGHRLAELGLVSFPKTTGGKGMHVVAPLVRRTSWDDLKAFAKAVAERLEADSPKRYVAIMTKARRTGRVFVDYLRNGEGATAVGAYSTRAREGAPVSTPLRWDEVTPRLDPKTFTVARMAARLAEPDPWEGFFELHQSITQEMVKKLFPRGS